MKAFLSYSSKDDFFISEVAKQLGVTQYELDRKTFELTLNVAAIMKALARSAIYVLFLSKHSITSSFVAEEQRSALEARGRGTLKKILIFAIDDTSYSALPAWLRDVNVATHISSPKVCARKIQSALIEITAAQYGKESIYLGREDDERVLRRALAMPPAKCPTAIHIVGHHGVGRRTLLRKVFSNVFPRQHEMVEVSLSRYEGLEDLYRQLYDLHIVSSMKETIRAFEEFGALNEAEQQRAAAELIKDVSEEDEFVLIIDDGGIYTDGGDYHEYMRGLVAALSETSRPIVGFIQTRMMPASVRANYPLSHHQFVRQLDNESTKELLSFKLKLKGVPFTEAQIERSVEYLDGHPYNVEFFAVLAESYGIESILLDPADLLEWKARRAEDFISKLTLTDIEVDILAALVEYPYLAVDLLLGLNNADALSIARALRSLEDYCCVERRQSYYQISAAIREAVRRNRKFAKTDEWRRALAVNICEWVKEYKTEDHIRVSVIESATLAAVRIGEKGSILSALILPSHLLRCAREMYDAEKRPLCIELCERALQMKDRLTKDGQIEALRLLGLSYARLGQTAEVSSVVERLRSYTSRTAKRVALFVEGFRERLAGRLDEAEDKFLGAWALSKTNLSINRELASLYCKQRRYVDAEEYARAAYSGAPTNPYILDIMAESLLGKLHDGLPIDLQELNNLLGQLKVYGDAPGSSFYLIREAHRLLKDRHYVEARQSIDRAIERTPALLSPYFMRIDICLAQGDVRSAERDLDKVNKLLIDAGGFSEGDEVRVSELTIKIAIEKKQFRSARKEIETNAFLPEAVRRRLAIELGKSIAFAPDSADEEMKRWAKEPFDGRRGAVGRRRSD